MDGSVAFLLTILCSVVTALVEFDNRVTGTPIIECERDYIKFTVPTKKQFNGKVYVKGEYSNSDCIRNYGLYRRTGSYGNTAGSGPRADDFHQFSTVPLDVGGDAEFLSTPYSASSSSQFKNGYDSNHLNGGQNSGDSRSEGNQKTHFFKGNRPGATKVLEDRHGKGGGLSSSSTSSSGARGHPSYHGSASGGSGSGYGDYHSTRHGSSFEESSSISNQNSLGSASPFRVRPDKNGECPLTCPPCASCDQSLKGLHKATDDLVILRPRRSNENTDTAANLEVKLGTCNARRDRTVNPAGIHISFTVVVSFHENFVTKVDKAYHISCSYEEVDRTVSTQIDVSAPPEVNLEGTIDPPQCRYRISRPNGEPVRDVNVGTPIEHRWECSSPNGYDQIHEIYGLLVHNCYVEDGRGRRELVIDDKGCSVQPLVIGTPVYSETSMSATIQSLVVKFPDRDTLDFQCSFYSCLKADGGCQAVTPPRCNNSRSRRDVDSSVSETDIQTRDEWKLHAQRLHVIDIDADIKQSDIDELQALVSLPPQQLVRNRFEDVCVSVISFGLIIASSTFLLTVSLIVLTGLAFMRAGPSVGKRMSYQI